MIAIEGPDLDRFIGSATDAIVGKAAQTMLTPGIYDAYCSGTATVDAVSMVLKVGEGQPSRLDGTEGDNRLTIVPTPRRRRSSSPTSTPSTTTALSSLKCRSSIGRRQGEVNGRLSVHC
ncbi:hypothetical protein J8I32_29300 [Cupriavidus sp. AcVe19-1a]|nr:hypothetical protein [Cupriavidus sp. AcVe19-1a]